MSADLPKVLHKIDGRPLLHYVIDAVQPLCGGDVYVVIGYGADLVRDVCRNYDVRMVVQEEQLGTGHAVQQCEGEFDGFEGVVVVLNGDVPGLRTETIRRFLDHHERDQAAATVLTAELADPSGYGRIVKDASGALQGIVEHKDADGKVLAIREINSGLFCFDKQKLFEALKFMSRDNVQNEYYLTDVIAILREWGERVGAFCVEDSREVAGINTDDELRIADRYIRGRRP